MNDRHEFLKYEFLKSKTDKKMDDQGTITLYLAMHCTWAAGFSFFYSVNSRNRMVSASPTLGDTYAVGELSKINVR